MISSTILCSALLCFDLLRLNPIVNVLQSHRIICRRCSRIRSCIPSRLFAMCVLKREWPERHPADWNCAHGNPRFPYYPSTTFLNLQPTCERHLRATVLRSLSATKSTPSSRSRWLPLLPPASSVEVRSAREHASPVTPLIRASTTPLFLARRRLL